MMNCVAKSLLTVATALVFAATAGAADVVLKLAHNGPEQHPFQAGAETFKRVLEEETGGAVEVQIFPGEQLGPEDQTSQMVKQGTLACAVESAGGGLAPFVPQADLFNMPFIFRDMDHFYRVVDGSVGERLAGEVESNLNSVFLGWWFSGVRNVWNSKHPIDTPEDLEGLKIRVMGSPVLIDTFNALGAQATPMSFGEVYTSLQQGVIDGAETDHVDLLVENFFEVTQHVSLTGHMYLAAGLICSKKVFEELSPEVQAAVRKAGAEASAAERAAMETMTEDALVQLKEKGLKFHEVDVALFQAKVQPVYEKNADQVGGMAAIEEIAAQ